jgi:hypothetical protein
MEKSKNWRHDIMHNDTQHNDTQHNDIRHNDTKLKDTQQNNKLSMTLITIMLSKMVECCHAECLLRLVSILLIVANKPSC